MSQVFFILDVEPAEAQLEQCGPVRKAELADKWLLTVSETGDAGLVGAAEDRLTEAQARALTSASTEWNGNAPGSE